METLEGSRGSRGRAALLARRLKFDRLLLTAVAMLLVLPLEPAGAAQLQLTHSGQGDYVGDPVRIGARILASGQEGPGEVSITLSWGEERISPYWLGAMTLEALPSVLNPSVSVAMGSNCDAAVGALAGRCDLTVTFDEPTQDGVNDLVAFDFTYRWVLAPGYELCTGQDGDAGCVFAGQQVQVIAESTVFGELSPSAVATFGTFAGPRVRPIPEPSVALLSALGLGLLSQRKRPRTPRRDARARR